MYKSVLKDFSKNYWYSCDRTPKSGMSNSDLTVMSHLNQETVHKILVILERNYDYHRTFHKSLIVCAGVLSFDASGQVYMYEIEP